jgi:putative ABC transport system ATP-binding protein
MSEVGIVVRDLKKSFPRAGGLPATALNGITLTVPEGEFAFVVGHNGSGKSTLLNILAGEIESDSGGAAAFITEKERWDLLKLPRVDRASLIARVHQDPDRGTVSDLTVWENLRLAALESRWASPFRFSSSQETRKALGTLLEPVGLASKLELHARHLSGGERQLLAIVMALSRKPRLLLLDEFTSSLDSKNSEICLQHAIALASTSGATVLAVTHDFSEPVIYGDRVIALREGKVAGQILGASRQKVSLEQIYSLCSAYGTDSMVPK